ncbi:MAG: hypothetical protein L0216_12710 [Planctomycetales bacterium]|nr:hypothetical protein [Planctomycetales bacterium]
MTEATRAAGTAAALGLAAAVVSFLLADPGWVHSGDQANVAAMLLADRDPAAFRDDPLLGEPRLWSFYLPAYRWLLGALWAVAGDLGLAHRLLAALAAGIYVAGATLLFGRASGPSTSLGGASLAAGALVAVASTTVRDALGGTYWGVGPISTAQPRTVALALVPWLALGSLRLAGSRATPLVLLGAGLLANLHPPTSFFLAVGLLAAEAVRRTPWARIGLAAAAAGLGALPALVSIAASRGFPTGVSPATLAEIVAERFAPDLLPPPGSCLRDAGAAVLLPAFLAVIAWRGLRSRGLPPGARDLAVAGLAAFAAAVVGQGLAQLAGWLSGGPSLTLDLLRGSRFLYLALFAGIAAGLGEFLRGGLLPVRRATRPLFAVAVAAALLVPPAAVRRTVSSRARAREEAAAERAADLRGAGEWLRANAPGALVATEDAALRVLGRCAIAFSYDDAGFLLHAAPDRLVGWAQRSGAWRDAQARRDGAALRILGRVGGASYALVPAASDSGPAAWRGRALALVVLGD